MTKQITLEELKSRYCDTIKTDTDGKQYIKLPVDGYWDIEGLRISLIKSIEYICILDEVGNEASDLLDNVKNLSRLALSLEMYSECEGLDRVIGDNQQT